MNNERLGELGWLSDKKHTADEVEINVFNMLQLMYKESRRQTNSITKRKRRAYINSITLKSEQDFKGNILWESYKGLILNKVFSPEPLCVKTKTGSVIEEEDMWHVWLSSVNLCACITID